MTDARTDDELAVQDRVRVEADVYGRTLAFRTVIVKVCPTELWLGLPSADSRLDTLRPDQALGLTVARRGGALLGSSGFLRSLGGSKSRIFAVVRPPFFERVQRRAQLRYDIEVPVSFRQVDPTTREPRGKGAQGSTTNVSPGGMLFRSDVQVEVGQELDIVLPLSASDRISTLGVVTRLRMPSGLPAGVESDPAWTAGCEIAVKFTRMTSVDQDRIVRFILMTEHRRREAALRQPSSSPSEAPAVAPVVAPSPPGILRVPLAPAAAQVPATAAPARAPAPAAAPAPAPVFNMDPDQPPIAFGLALCSVEQPQTVRKWFDSLMPFDRIELLSQLQANMAGERVPGASEPASVRPLALALGLLAA
jgi:hypothetical protein